MHASQIQDCIVEQRLEKKRKIVESVWVHNVVAVWRGKVNISVNRQALDSVQDVSGSKTDQTEMRELCVT